MDKHPALIFFQSYGRKVLTNFNADQPNICMVDNDVKGSKKVATGILTQINDVYLQVQKLNKLFHDQIDFPFSHHV